MPTTDRRTFLAQTAAATAAATLAAGADLSHRVITAPVEKEREWLVLLGQHEYVVHDKPHGQLRLGGPLSGLLNGQAAEIDSCHIEALLGQPESVDASAAAQLDDAAGLNRLLGNDPRQLGRGLPGFPGRLATLVVRIPVDVAHDCVPYAGMKRMKKLSCDLRRKRVLKTPAIPTFAFVALSSAPQA